MRSWMRRTRIVVTNGLARSSSELIAYGRQHRTRRTTKRRKDISHTRVRRGLRHGIGSSRSDITLITRERICVNFSDSEDVTTAWMNSPKHRANILSTDFTQIGIAAAQGVYEGETHHVRGGEFGTPAPPAAPNAVCGHRKRRDGAGGCSSSNACTSGDANRRW